MKTKPAEQPMDASTRARLFRLRCASKRGDPLAPEEVRFLEDCWKKFPQQYTEMRDAVFNETRPFGSRPPSK